MGFLHSLHTLGSLGDQLIQDDFYSPVLHRISTFCSYQLKAKMLKNSKETIIHDFTYCQISHHEEEDRKLGKIDF